VLRLPGLRARQLNGAYLLGGPSHESFPVTSSQDGASVRVGKGSLAGAGYIPVIVLWFSGNLEVAQPAIAPDGAGNFFLKPSAADHFFNYNGAGYEAPETLYKLRWFLVAPPGRYHAEIEVKPQKATAQLDLVVDGRRIPLTVPSSAAATVTIKRNIRVSARFRDESPVSIELTPPEPFVKGTQLSCDILTVRLVRESDPLKSIRRPHLN
jgi:alpha-L-fucosidase